MDVPVGDVPLELLLFDSEIKHLNFLGEVSQLLIFTFGSLHQTVDLVMKLNFVISSTLLQSSYLAKEALLNLSPVPLLLLDLLTVGLRKLRRL